MRLRASFITRKQRATEDKQMDETDDLSFASGFVNGVVISFVIWAAIILAWVWILF